MSDLSEACLSLTPKVATFFPNTLFLDIGITQLVFGGEERQLLAAEELWETFHLDPTYVVCDQPEWAWPLATEKRVVIPAGKSQKRLYQLSIDRLRFCGTPAEVLEQERERIKLVAFMARVGMKTVGDFMKLSPLAINRRFGKMGCQLQQWLSGEREFPLPTFFPQSDICESVEAEDVSSIEQLLFLLRGVLSRIEARLKGRCRAAKKMKMTFFLDSHPPLMKELVLAEPLQRADHFLKLLKDFLNQTTWKSPLQSVKLEIPDTIPHQMGQLSLFDLTENRQVDLGQYVSRLRSRFGDKCVGFAELKESHLPERSWTTTWPPKASTHAKGHFPKRPLFIFDPPKPYHPSENSRLIPLENLTAHWWEFVGERRYYIAESPKEQLWIYWDFNKEAWFLHGTFD